MTFIKKQIDSLFFEVLEAVVRYVACCYLHFSGGMYPPLLHKAAPNQRVFFFDKTRRLRTQKRTPRLGITTETARTALKRVFSKTGVSRPSELVALLTKPVLRKVGRFSRDSFLRTPNGGRTVAATRQNDFPIR